MSSDMALEIYLKGVENGTVENHCCVRLCEVLWHCNIFSKSQW